MKKQDIDEIEQYCEELENAQYFKEFDRIKGNGKQDINVEQLYEELKRITKNDSELTVREKEWVLFWLRCLKNELPHQPKYFKDVFGEARSYYPYIKSKYCRSLRDLDNALNEMHKRWEKKEKKYA